MWKSKCDWMRNFLFPSLAWLCRLPGCLVGMYTAQGGQWISPNNTKARELRLWMKQLASHNLPLLGIKSSRKREKQLWSALSFTLFLALSSLPPHFALPLSSAISSVHQQPSILLSRLITTYYNIRSHCSCDICCSRCIFSTADTRFSRTLHEVWYDVLYKQNKRLLQE